MTQHKIPLPTNVQALVKVQGALLGAAVGDALGWPQEIPKKNLSKKAQNSPSFEFHGWQRKAGGQYRPHTENILPGEYSDDMQLLLCTARSLLYGDQWLTRLTKFELPIWLHYERGGGGATLKSVRSWTDGKVPWSGIKNREKYLGAGGNGVAMRILPHCILGIFDSDFRNISRAITANGLLTHGHPRALVGALAYGFALWSALRETQPLSYGQLIEKLVEEQEKWSPFPDLDLVLSDNQKDIRTILDDRYRQEWQAIVHEMQALLKQSLASLDQGAIAIDSDFLEQIGCFGKQKGSGVITAAGAIFLASRYAADPSSGLLEAAFAHGADTDTLASMTGALLGSISGSEWLGMLAEQVQDADYIKRIGQKILNKDFLLHRDKEVEKDAKPFSKEIFEQLEHSNRGETIALPDFREAKILDSFMHPSSAKSARAKSWNLHTTDGQLLYFKKTWYKKSDEKPKASVQISSQQTENTTPSILNLDAELLPVKTRDTSVRLLVNNINESRFFYGKVLGLTCVKESKDLFKYGNIWIMEFPNKGDENRTIGSSEFSVFQDSKPHVWVEVESLEAVYENVKKVGLGIVKPVADREGTRYFICRDPSGYLILVNEVR